MKELTNLFMSTLCLLGLTAPIAAQGGKTLPAAARALTQKAPVRMLGTKRFMFPKQIATQSGLRTTAQVNVALQRNIAQAQLAPDAATPIPPLPTFAILSQGRPEKTFLELTAQERAFYQQETTVAFNLLSEIKATIATQDIAETESMLTSITSVVITLKNDYLRNLSLNLLAEGDLETLAKEISEYYSLGMPFEDAAFNYTLRHPYKRNLQTMRLLHNPFILDSFKEPVQYFTSQPIIAIGDRESFKQALHDLQTEYERVLEGAANTPAIHAQIEYYEKTINDLYRFIEKNGRLPKWNTRSEAEQELHNRVDFLLTTEKEYAYEPFAEYHQTLRAIVEAHAPTYLTKNQTLQAFEKFVQLTGRLYPRSLHDKGDISWDEEQLFDNLMYWRTQDESGMNRAIVEIQNRHAQPQDNFYK